MQPRPIVLVIFDGWGYNESPEANAIAAANTPNWDKLWKTAPHTLLSACGLDVGLPEGQMGNSEVGHLTMGAGRVVYQDLTRITEAIKEGSFYTNHILIGALKKANLTHHTVHIMGLLSPGGVHSHETHLFAMIDLAVQNHIQNIAVHVFLDGRDTPPKSALDSIAKLEALCCKSYSTSNCQIHIASLSGRFYAMDRDNRWERTEKVYSLLTEGTTDFTAKTATDALLQAYERGETDEFVTPTFIAPFIKMQDSDVVFFINFRADRARQLSYALTAPDFSHFHRKVRPKLSQFVSFTSYAPNLNADVAFPAANLKNTLGEFLELNSLKQLKIAETEKYAHVTYFFNGGHEHPFRHEDRILIPSPKVSTYDQCPAMSAREITIKLVEAILSRQYDVIICNYANADMLGHTGNFEATVEAIEILDQCLGDILRALQFVGGELLITADHGNAEMMFDPSSQQPHTAHTNQKVPFIYSGRPAVIIHEKGTLSDVAPTLLALLGFEPPIEMTGKNILAMQSIPVYTFETVK